MLRIRRFEETLLKLFSQGHLRGTVHTCLGQEASAVGLVGALDASRDTVSSNHRGHGHFLAFHDDMRGVLAEILGLPSGICRGLGGSQHLHAGNFYSNGILGGMVPVTAGMALAQKLDGKHGVSVVFSGDGAMAEGVVYEALNMAALWQLPLLLAIEHNGIAQSTPWTLEHGSLVEGRPPAFGLPTEVVDGNDVRAVRAAALRTLAEMRARPHPRCLVLQTARLGPHSKGDDHRSAEEMARIHAGDPLRRAEADLPADVVADVQARATQAMLAVLAEFGLG